jgi:hypothetical protein
MIMEDIRNLRDRQDVPVKPAWSLHQAILPRKRKGDPMHKKDREERPVQGRVLARLLADELMNVPAGGVGPTTKATNGDADITNGALDNDGPHVPPPI